MIITKIMIAINDKIATYITGGTIGGGVTSITITSFMEKTTPIIVYLSLIVTLFIGILMGIYWWRKLFSKKSKNKIDE